MMGDMNEWVNSMMPEGYTEHIEAMKEECRRRAELEDTE
jgi:hypothetical protein